MPEVLNDSTARFALQSGTDGGAMLTLSGRLDARSTAELWRQVEARLRQSPSPRLEVDASGVDYCDGAGLALLSFLRMGGMSPEGGHVTVRGLRPEFESLSQRFTQDDYQKNRPAAPEKIRVAEETGAAVIRIARDMKAEVSFLGEAAAGMMANLAPRGRMRWTEVARVFTNAGVNALPIVSLISLLVGLIIAFESASPFRMFGAQIFIANMIGIVMARELGPLMTGIILAGRSGSAFAAELGTMKVNEELNALETMGLNPIRFLVAQRIFAGILLMPLLCIYSIVVGIAGGVLVMLAMGFPLSTIYQQMAQSLSYSDLLIGTSKGLVFGALIAGVGCLRGMQTKKGPSAVGESTTRAVVSGILLVIIADAVFAVVLYALDI